MMAPMGWTYFPSAPGRGPLAFIVKLRPFGWPERVLHGALKRLEPCAGKLASTVLRGGGGGNAASLTRPSPR